MLRLSSRTCSVCLHAFALVPHKSRLVAETSITRVTFIRFFPRVDSLVNHKVEPLTETFAALGTGKGTLSGMSPSVELQDGLSDETFPAVWAGEALVFFV